MPTVESITQPSCAVATGSVVLTGLPAGNWIINPGAITGNGTSKTISDLAAGTYNFTVSFEGGCTSAATADVIFTAYPGSPTAPITGVITQPTCEAPTGSVVLSGLPSGNWTINPGAVTGSGTSFTVSGLTTGTHSFSVTNETGCVSPVSANVIINAVAGAPEIPIVGTVTQPSCAVATGSVVLSGLPSGNWTIDPGAVKGTGSSVTLSGLAAGPYNFSVINETGCSSAPSATVVLTAFPGSPEPPTVEVTQPTCALATGSVLLTGLPAGNWTINPGAITGSGISTTISGLAIGSHTFTVTNSTGCISAPSSEILILPYPGAPTAPVIGTIAQPTCADATGSIILTGLPSGNWTVNPGAITGSGANTTIAKLNAGIYNFTVTNETGCISPVSEDAVVVAFPGAPVAPTADAITQPSCATATGSVVLSGLPAGVWAINPGAVPGTGSGTTISGLEAGTYNFTVINDAGCISPATADIIIVAYPGTPAAPVIGTITPPNCLVSTGSVTLDGLPSGDWTINPGAITGSGASTTISGLAVGTYNFTVTSATGCNSSASANAVIDPPSTESAIQSKELSAFNGFNISCTGKSDGYIRLVLSDKAAPYTFSWSGPDSFTSSSQDISGLKAGQYILTIADVNTCTSTETFNLTEPQPLSMTIERSVSTDGKYNINCAGVGTGSATVSAVNNVGSVNYLWSDGFTGNSRTGLLPGMYQLIITDSNNCTADSTVTLTAPDSIKISSDITQPFCPGNSNGAINLTVTGGNPGTDYIYSWSNNSTNKDLLNIPVGLYIVSVADMNGCSARDSIQVDPLNETCLVIPNAFSPNGDLINDVWNIGHIEQYPLAEVKVFNNWGVTVWKSETGYP